MTSATLTLGQSSYKLDPYNYPIKVSLESSRTKEDYDKEAAKYGYNSSSKYNTKGTSSTWSIETKGSEKLIKDLSVRTTEASSHTIQFKSAAARLDIDITNAQSGKYAVDSADSITFSGSVQSAKIVTGNSTSKDITRTDFKGQKGDTVTFAKNATAVDISTGCKVDSVSFYGKVTGATIDVGLNTDSVTFASKEKLTGVSVNLGKDKVRDVVSFASKDSLNKTEIVNFVDKVDQIKVEGKVYDNMEDIKKQFGDNIIFRST